MIRVIYRWKVQHGEEEKFKTAWAKATTTIRASTDGARGSLLLRSCQDPTEFITIARWSRIEDWKAFWDGSIPSSMQQMHTLAQRLSVEAYDEVEDHTV